jgi:NAD-dependent dihydropyrimidine dehydrogenase PreA subunit
MVYIDSERCTGCGACVEVCPTGAIRLVEDITGRRAQIDRAVCRECQACIQVCPEEAIRVEAEPAVEGELVLAEPGTVQVKTRLPEPQPARPALRALAWLGPALAFVGREIVPRVAASLLDAWDRRASGPTPTLRVPDDSTSVRSARQSTPGLPGTGSGRYRWRRGRGR